MVQYSMRQNSTSNTSNSKNLVHDGTTAATTGSDEYNELTPEEKVYRDSIIPLLLVRAYHLPNHTYYQDLQQYLCNNHPLFGIFWHHKYHPIQRNIRIVSLIGSMLFGLAITNIIYLAFVFADTDYDTTYVQVNVADTTTMTSHSNNTTSVIQSFVDTTAPALSITNGNIALWTIGAFLHAAFDNLIWSLAACSCCTSSTSNKNHNNNNTATQKNMARYRNTGVVLVILFVVIATALATLAVALRAAISSPDATNTTTMVDPDTVQSYGLTDDTVQLFQIDTTNAVNDFEFIIAYLIELVLNYCIYYPIVGTLLFSGVLSLGGRCCNNLLGGRPYEIIQLEQTEQKQQRRDNTND